MKVPIGILLLFLFNLLLFACDLVPNQSNEISAAEILGNPDFQCISYGGYRSNSRNIQPTIKDIKEDLRILSAVGIKVIRTYNVNLEFSSNVLIAIEELKNELSDFEMYVMLGAWVDCKNAWTDKAPIHDLESEANANEINRAVSLANKYPDIVKIISVGNEAMVKWATAYYVEPWVILKWVNYLQNLKSNNKLNNHLWITSSDNFASWGGGSKDYHVPQLDSLIEAVDFISMHTYPMHDTHYNPNFWHIRKNEINKTKEAKIEASMDRAFNYARSQYLSVKKHLDSLGINKAIHIGETGWASQSNWLYGAEGSAACDEIKQSIYYYKMRQWSNNEGISCFFFEAFDEPWKDAANPGGSENHFGLFTVDGKAKYVLWDSIDAGRFKNLSRGKNTIRKSFGGNIDSLSNSITLPPQMNIN